MPGATPPFFQIVEEAHVRHICPQAARFAARVFSLHDLDELEALLGAAGFTEVTAETVTWTFRLPPPAVFLRQYIHSTPLATFGRRGRRRPLPEARGRGRHPVPGGRRRRLRQ